MMIAPAMPVPIGITTAFWQPRAAPSRNSARPHAPVSWPNAIGRPVAVANASRNGKSRQPRLAE